MELRSDYEIVFPMIILNCFLMVVTLLVPVQFCLATMLVHLGHLQLQAKSMGFTHHFMLMIYLFIYHFFVY